MTSDQTQAQRTWCVSRPKFQGLGFGSSAKQYDQRSLPDVNGLISGQFPLSWSDQGRIRAHFSLIRGNFERIFVVFFNERWWLCQGVAKKQHSDQWHINMRPLWWVGTNGKDPWITTVSYERLMKLLYCDSITRLENRATIGIQNSQNFYENHLSKSWNHLLRTAEETNLLLSGMKVRSDIGEWRHYKVTGNFQKEAKLKILIFLEKNFDIRTAIIYHFKPSHRFT